MDRNIHTYHKFMSTEKKYQHVNALSGAFCVRQRTTINTNKHRFAYESENN